MWFQTSSSQDIAAWLGTDLIYSILKTFYLQYILATTSTSKLPQKNFGSIILLRGIKRTYIIEFDLPFQHWVPRNEHGAKVPLADFSRIELFFKWMIGNKQIPNCSILLINLEDLILNFHGLHKSITLRKKKKIQFVKGFVVSWYCSVLYRRTYLQIFPYTYCNQIRKPKLKELSFTPIGRKRWGSLEKISLNWLCHCLRGGKA